MSKKTRVGTAGWKKVRVVMEMELPPAAAIVANTCDFFHDGKWQHCAPGFLSDAEIISTRVKELSKP